MSFSGRTPESQVSRSDSKNPATTCKGITSNGRPCRRALAASPSTSPAPSPGRGHGVLAVLNNTNAAAFYCWQHKDQAEQLTTKPDQSTKLYPLKERSSIDTLVERIGVLNLDEAVGKRKKKHTQRYGGHEQRLRNRDTLPSGWNEMQGPLMTVPDNGVRKQKHQQSHGRSNVKFSWTCCIQEEDEDLPPPRRTYDNKYNRTEKVGPDLHQRPGLQPSTRTTLDGRPASTSHTHTLPPATFAQRASYSQPPSPSPQTRPPLGAGGVSSTSQTTTLLSFIPPNLSPKLTSQLLAELSRPISSADDEGYIYIFWLTPESTHSKPDDETASSLLDDEPSTSPIRNQRTTAALQRYASTTTRRKQRTITLKIGRAANVHRRMSQWTKQCGQNITLVRYYPYTSSAATKSSPQPRKVKHVHRVERLIHIELSAARADLGECDQCGREHREWFEVEASRRGLKTVDEVVRRWVGWAEQ